MKTTLLALLLFPGIFRDKTEGLELEISLKGLRSSQGTVRLALYREKDAFPSVESVYRSQVIPASRKTVSFQGLAAGTYAIAVFHDMNQNGLLDKNFWGVPVEVYGFSNNARGVFSPPAFKEAAIELKTARRISITLK